MIDPLEQHPSHANRFTPHKADKAIHTRKITWLVGSSLAVLGIFLIAVCALSWFSLQRFQGSLSELAQQNLPDMFDNATESFKLSQMLVSAERLIHVEDEAEQRLAFRELRRQMDELLAGSGIGDDILEPARLLNNHFERLNALVGDRLENRRRTNVLLDEIDTLAISLATNHSQPNLTEEKAAVMHRAVSELFRTVFTARNTVSGQQAVNPGRFARRVDRQMDVIIQTVASAYDGASPFPDLLERIRDLLTGPSGLAAVMQEQHALRSDIRSMHSVARGMMTELETMKVTRFNQLISAAGTLTDETHDAIGMFARLFIGITLLALVLSLGVYVYFRRAFIIRLERLNKGLIDGIAGKWKDLDVSGSDEITIIARSVNHFARELSITTKLAEASNEAKSSFLANMSHEIRTPMNAIIGFNRMLSETVLTPKQREYVKKVDNSATLLLGIINDILDFSKIEQGKLDILKEPFEVHSLIDNVVAGVEPKAREKGLSLVIKVDPDLPRTLIGDPLRIFQICSNMCDNAVKFTSAGAITIDIRLDKDLKDTVKVRFSITDQGIGMNPDEISTLFKPFTQADVSSTRRFGGTGLGLSICRSLCELMGGSVGVTSKPDEGSTFYFLLPLGKTAQAPHPSHIQMSLLPPDLSGKRLLLVEDNIINQEIILELTDRTGADVAVAANGQEAVDLVASSGKGDIPYFDLIIMDIQMPVMDGLTASRHIRDMDDPRKADVCIVAMTAHAMQDDRQICLDSGMDDYLTKPVDPTSFYNALKTLTANGQTSAS